MDKKTLLAILLTAVVVVITPIIFPSPSRPVPTAADSVAMLRRQDSIAKAAAAASPATTTQAAPTVSAAQTKPATSVPAPKPTVVQVNEVRTARSIYSIASPGGAPTAITLPDYRSLRPGGDRSAPVQLLEDGDKLFKLSIRTPNETVSLDSVSFQFASPRQEGTVTVQTLTSTSLKNPITLTYRIPADSFIVHVEGTIAGATSGQVALWLPSRIRSDEADLKDDTRHLAMAYRIGGADAKSRTFSSIDTVPKLDSGAVRWFAIRNKYFVVGALTPDSSSSFGSLISRGEPHTGDATIAHVSATLPVANGKFAFRIFAGPQSWRHLLATAPEFENVNPYGGWLHGAVQPFATIVMRLLLWIKSTTALSYGWVLVIFGVVVRVLMWPLNQNAMRSSMKLQRIQPQLQELQTKFKNDPEKQRDAMMKLYSENGMSPFTPILGCLPMLLPMPILFALYFVFQNTIELRGVSFLWLPDLSLMDPLYITPLFMGASMFLLSWIGMRGMPPNPQSKMMSYIMPVMFTFLFWKFASGLNLYYAVQNIAALPQQWMLANERTKPKVGG